MIRNIHSLNRRLVKRAYRKFQESDLWRGPSLHFHRWTISRLRQKQEAPDFTYLALSQDQYFLILLYGTLATWGLHRMGSRRRMVSFEAFREEIEPILPPLDEIGGITLSGAPLDEIEEGEPAIKSLFQMAKITERVGEPQPENNRRPILVANSKLLHHLHPCLFPPIDWQYIFRYFYVQNINATNVYRPLTINTQAQRFWEILIEYKNFYDSHQDIVDNYLNQNLTGMETSVTKIIDNIVVGRVKILRDEGN